MKERKPKYFRHFLKKLLPCLMTAVLVGASCTAGLYGIRYQSVRNYTRKLYSDYLTVFHEGDIAMLTADDLNYQLANRVYNDINRAYADVAFLLEREDTGEVYTSAQMFYAVEVHMQDAVSYYSHDEALFSYYEDFLSMQRKHSLTRDDFDFKVQDLYVPEGSTEFLPGNVDIIRTSFRDGRSECMESRDFTPADTSGYAHVSRGGGLGFCTVIGSAQDSKALAYVQSLGANDFDRGHLLPPPGEPMEVLSGEHELFLNDDGAGVRCYLRSAVYYHFWAEQKWTLLAGYGVLILLACITAAITAGFSCAHARKVWEMAEYRRNLTNTLAHDLKSPLTAIAGYAENLYSGMHKEKQDYYIGAILQNAQYMDKMITDVLELSSLETVHSVRKEQTDVMKLLREAFSQYEPELTERHITLHIDGDCTALADQRMMAQATGNLASNAVRYTPYGETITVSGSAEKLAVTNDCENTPDVSQLAEPFAKGDAARNDHSGSGLGLTIVRQIMELHRGRLVLNAEDGQFTAELWFS